MKDGEKIDNSLMKSNFIKKNQHGAQVDDECQNNKFLFGEDLNYLQVGNGYLEFQIKVRKLTNTSFIAAADNTNEVIRLVNSALAFTIHDVRFSTSAGTEKKTE